MSQFGTKPRGRLIALIFRVPLNSLRPQAIASPLLPRKLSSTMSDPPDPGSSQTAAPSSNFKSMLDAALVEYKKKTGDDLLAHWLALEVQTCQSVDAVLDILREQAKAVDRSGDQKLMK